jgi:predicted aspartyl protease
VVLAFAAPCGADLTFHTATDTQPWPPGTERVPIRMVNGQILVDATLRSPSGRTVSGSLVLDTGAPCLVVSVQTWNRLQLDTLVMEGSFYRQLRRSLSAVELGSARIPELAIRGVVDDSLIMDGTIGLLGPSLIQDRALVLDYQREIWALVPPRLAVVSRDSTSGASNLTRDGRIRRSRAAYAAVLAPEAVAVPFRLFEGGRILVSGRACEDDGSWCGSTLTLLLDTGASSCLVFDDVVAERVAHARAWAWLHDVPHHTMLGTSRMNATVVPRLELIEASRPLAVSRVDVGVGPRRALPDIEGTLPERIHGLLGETFLARFRIVLDYGNQIVWLERRPAMEHRAFREAHVGLWLERRWGAVRVAAVAPGSSAAASGITVGDVLVSIDGIAFSTDDTDGAESRLEGREGSDVLVVTRHEGWERVQRLRRTSRP